MVLSFRLINDPDGLNDLYISLYEKFNINKTALSFLRFKKFIKRLIKSSYNNKNKLYDDNLINLTYEFINEIGEIQYNGSPQFYFDQLSKFQKFLFYFKRIILRKEARNINLLNMILPVDEEKFFFNSEIYLNKIFSLSKDLTKDKNVVVNQGGNFWNPVSSTKFYGKNTYPILVTRDPKGIFWSMKRRNSLSYPGHDVEVFVTWYKKIMERINKKEFEQIIHIKYEDFFSNFSKEKIKLCNTLNIPSDTHDNFDLDYTKKNLFKFKKKLTQDEISYIDNKLKNYIQC